VGHDRLGGEVRDSREVRGGVRREPEDQARELVVHWIAEQHPGPLPHGGKSMMARSSGSCSRRGSPVASRTLNYVPEQVVVDAFAGPETIPDELLHASLIDRTRAA